VVFLIRFPYILNYVNMESKLQSLRIMPIMESVNVDRFLLPYTQKIGADIDGYRNHILRVMSFATHILKSDETNTLTERDDGILAAALVYHDLGLWSDDALAYLEPSAARAQSDLRDTFNDYELDIIHNIIVWHHKLSPYESGKGDKKMESIVNAVRRADWIDFSLGFIGMGMPGSHVEKVRNAIPNAGFHMTLIRFGPRLRGWDIPTIVKELSSIFKL
jgi:hypothetical protein